MGLVRRIPSKAKRTGRWRSPGHLTFVRKHACCVCDSETAIEAAHLRIGTDGSMGAKPSDYFTTPLCKRCHDLQHTTGEFSFWMEVKKDPMAIIEELCRTSPKAAEIRSIRNAQG